MSDITVIEETGGERRRLRRRPGVLYWGLTAVMLVLVGRSFFLQVVHGQDYELKAENNRVSAVPIMAARGVFYDRHGVQLVENVASTDLVIDPTVPLTAELETPLLDLLPELIEIPPEELRQLLAEAKASQRVVLLKKALDHDEVLQVTSVLDQLPGVRLVSSSVRKYPFGHSLAHVLGYSSLVTAEDLARRDYLTRTDITGKSGLEWQYDEQLRGTHGARYVEVDALGRPQRDVRTEDPVAGDDIELTIDLELQKFIFARLAEEIPELPSEENTATAGAVVAIDPRDGSVRAMVSYPSYDPNVFAQPRFRAGTANVLTDERRPLLNRIVNGTYPPGSTIKPLLAAAGLEEGVISTGTSVLSIGGIDIDLWHFPDWKEGGHGPTTVTKAIAESVNTFFYLLAGGDEMRSGLGVIKMTEYLREFGWGVATRIDLPSEKNGLLPSPQWKQENKDERWYIGDTYHFGIGQGDVLATPLQVTLGTAAIANLGSVVTPHLFGSALSETGERKMHDLQQRAVPVSDANLAVVREGMRQTVTDGSGRSMAEMNLAIAGKTGTAQFGPSERTHAWFTSFAPYNDPELVLTVLIEEGGQGDEVAVPVAKEIWQWWAENRSDGHEPDAR